MEEGVTPPPDELTPGFCLTNSPEGEVRLGCLAAPENPGKQPTRSNASADAFVSPTPDSKDRGPWNPSTDCCKSADVGVGD